MLLQVHQQLKKLQEQNSKHHIANASNLPQVIEQIDTFTKSLLLKLIEKYVKSGHTDQFPNTQIFRFITHGFYRSVLWW